MIGLLALMTTTQLVSERPVDCATAIDCPTASELRQAVLAHESSNAAAVGNEWQRQAGPNGVVVGPDIFRLDRLTDVRCVGQNGSSTCAYVVQWGRSYRERAVADLKRAAAGWTILEMKSVAEKLR